MISVIRFFNYFEKKSLLSLTIEYSMVLYIQQLRKTTNGGKTMEYMILDMMLTLALASVVAPVAVGLYRLFNGY